MPIASNHSLPERHTFSFGTRKQEYPQFNLGLIRQLGLRLFVLGICFVYALAVLETDPADVGDTFGDVYDTYVASPPLHIPEPVTFSYQWNNTPLSAGIHLPQFPKCVYKRKPISVYYSRLVLHRLRRLHLLHDVWRL